MTEGLSTITSDDIPAIAERSLTSASLISVMRSAKYESPKAMSAETYFSVAASTAHEAV